MTHVLVLSGGPDAERDVSLASGKSVVRALEAAGAEVTSATIGRPVVEQLRAMPGDVIFPVLHGPFGEGGPLQDLLELDGRPYVGCRPRTARVAMDKMATKLVATGLQIPTPEACVFNPGDGASPIGFPAAFKPIHEGSTIGLHLCDDVEQWPGIRNKLLEDMGPRSYMVERRVHGRELTVGFVGDELLPVVEIIPAETVYDYEAKYTRDDTRYICEPDLPQTVEDEVRAASLALARALGVRHIARVDFLLDTHDVAWLLELNTMPGFTDHSLVPLAARHTGCEMPELCMRLVTMALQDAAVAEPMG